MRPPEGGAEDGAASTFGQEGSIIGSSIPEELMSHQGDAEEEDDEDDEEEAEAEVEADGKEEQAQDDEQGE